MKFCLQVLFLSLLTAQIHYPQWTNQNLVPDANDLWSTFFVDDSTGWIVGSGGFIKKTTNAGNEWIQQNSGTNLILKAVQFVDQNTGWICGESGLILKTIDGGTTWDSLSSGATQHLSDIYFYDADTGYVVGFNGTILKTTNGGSSWISLSSGTTNDLYAMDFVDAFIGYAAGEVNDTSSVIKTTDGGITWIDKSSGFPATSGNCLAVEFIDANTGFILSYKTTDGGDTWGSSDSPFPSKETETDTIDQLDIYPSGAGIKSIYFKDANNGWRVLWSGTDNSIYGTTDGGITWEMEYKAWDMYYNPLLSVFVSHNGTGLAVGRRGLICLKENTSSNWSRLFSGSIDDVYSIHFVDENIGWAAGSRYGNPTKGVILKTTNGGKIFKTQVESAYKIFCVYFFNENIGWTAGEHLSYQTTDGGENWSSTGGSYSSSVYFINQDTGWRTTYVGGSGIYKSTDGGVTWSQKSSIISSSVYFSDINNGCAVGAGGNILKSTDGGETWLAKTSGTTNDLNWVRFYNSNIGMCVGKTGTVLLSTDGGESWIPQNVGTSENLTAVDFTSPTTVWITGYNGSILNTTNLGYNWTSFDSVTTKDLTSLSFVNEYTGWVGGSTGMFKYSVEPPPPPTPPVWSNQITVKDAGSTESSIVLTFGQHIDATDSLDASLGEYELPPVPPTGIFDARFNLPTSFPISSIIDFRDSSETEIIWTLQLQPGSAGYPMTLSWDSTSFPEGTFYLKDRINASFVNVNMKNQSSYILTEPAITSLEISYKGNYSLVSVKNDWNMISVPLLAEDMTLNNLFHSTTSLAYRYNGGYIPEDTLKGGVGYWLKFDGDQLIQIFGSTMGDTVPLIIGWNMFGVYENNIPVSQITTSPPGIIATNLFGFNDGYYITDTLKSGQGYWVRVTQDGVINLNSGGLFKGDEQIQIAAVDKDWGRIIVTDNKGRSCTLFATEEKIDLTKFELPPMPPAGIFDVRFSSGKLAENLSGEKIIQINSDNYPITIKAEGINITIRDRINGDLLNEELKDGEEIRIANNKITSLEITGRITGGLPVSYELYQNYPNPFNPSTKIKFAIPKESSVNLSIYNVLGELVSILVNEQKKPGYYVYDFDASRLASGIYLYRITAGNYTETKKMLVIK